ncbi:hypothetical protein UO65_4183 [Actinokineospora spheciospongiae]|uniref:Uncharacterized protein n=1 Tax=Actinokineospora spheciospongiae TaxID=909613 RepID=W7IHY0_9PSEU|nr:hypothetical protein UO65_4183 [Actinokineospora spheciospongiae]
MPVLAQVSRFTRASALRARWLTRCALLHPGSRLGARNASSSSPATRSRSTDQACRSNPWADAARSAAVERSGVRWSGGPPRSTAEPADVLAALIQTPGCLVRARRTRHHPG